MAADFFEFSLRREILESAIIVFLLNVPGADFRKIVSESDFWGLELEENKHAIGVAVKYAESGFKTMVFGVSVSPVSGDVLGLLAKNAAIQFNTESAIGDYRDQVSNDRFLQFFPDGTVAEAIDDSTNGVNDLRTIRKIEYL